MRVTTIHGETIDLVPGITLSGAMLRDLNLDGVDLRGSSLKGCFFNESSLVGADLSGCDLTDAVFYRANLSGADLTDSVIVDCYWAEMTYSGGTKWPDTDSAPAKFDPLERTEIGEFMSVWKGGLCSPGAIEPGSLEGNVSPLAHFAAGLTPGPVTPSVAERLFLRLALNLYRIAKLSSHEEQSVFYPLSEWISTEEIHEESFEFTAAVLLLAALGLRVERVMNADSVVVSFHPQPDMRMFADHDVVRLFRLMIEVECGREVDPESTLRACATEPFEFGADYSFAHDELSHLDVSGAFDSEDQEVRVVGGPGAATSAAEALFSTIYAFCHFVTCSEFVNDPEESDEAPDDDEESWDEDDEDDVDDSDDDTGEGAEPASGESWACDREMLLYRALGITSIEWTADGYARAELTPPMDVEAVVSDAGFSHRECTLASLGLAGARPDFGAFAWVAN